VTIHVVRAEWGGREYIVQQEVPHTRGDGLDRTYKGVAAEAETDYFTTDSILLVGEREGDESGTIEVKGRGGRSEDAPVADIESDVLETKGCIVGCGSGVFTGPAEKEECERDHIDHGESLGGAVLLCEIGGVIYDGDWNGFDSVGGRVSARVAPELASKTEFELARSG
jgi:hypothetical protein